MYYITAINTVKIKNYRIKEKCMWKFRKTLHVCMYLYIQILSCKFSKYSHVFVIIYFKSQNKCKNHDIIIIC